MRDDGSGRQFYNYIEHEEQLPQGLVLFEPESFALVCRHTEHAHEDGVPASGSIARLFATREIVASLASSEANHRFYKINRQVTWEQIQPIIPGGIFHGTVTRNGPHTLPEHLKFTNALILTAEERDSGEMVDTKGPLLEYTSLNPKMEGVYGQQEAQGYNYVYLIFRWRA